MKDALVNCESKRHLSLKIAYRVLPLVKQLELLGLLLFLCIELRFLRLHGGSCSFCFLFLKHNSLCLYFSLTLFLPVLLSIQSLLLLGLSYLHMDVWSEVN